MLDGFYSNATRAAATDQQNPPASVPDIGIPADFTRLSGDQIERLIAYCKAPALLWKPDARPARAPEPFGMIA